MTRDSNVWWWVMGGVLLTAVSSRMDLLDALFPAHLHKQMHAIIELASIVAMGVAGKMSWSPLPVSPEGRQEALREKSQTLDQATAASLDAAVKVDKAVDANIVASQATETAKDLSEKAAGQ